MAAKPSSVVTTSTASRIPSADRFIYPSGQVHPAPLAHPIVVVSLSDLHNQPSDVSDDELFQSSLEKLEPYVGEEGKGGYILVVLAAEENIEGKGKRRSKPGVAWWIWRWKRVPYKYRKNLKRMYLVHPSSFTRTVVPLILPFLTPKAYAKLYPLSSLLQLSGDHGVSPQGIRLPVAVLEEEMRIRRASSPAKAPTWASSVSAAVGLMGAYLPFSGILSTSAPRPPSQSKGYWGRTMDDLVEECGGVPPILEELRETILSGCLTEEGIFRRTPGSHLRAVLVDLLDLPLFSQPNLPWGDIARLDPLLPPKLVSRLLSHAAVPIICPDQYHLVRKCETAESVSKVLLPALSPATRLVLTEVISLLHEVSKHASETRMTPLNLAICIAPDLIKGPDALEDASLCLQPGKKMPMQMMAGRADKSAEGKGTLVGLLEIWIRDFDSIAR